MHPGDPEAALRTAGLELPPAPAPVASYVPWRLSGDQRLYVSGQIPTRQGQLIAKGRVPSQVPVEQAIECARLCALNAMACVKAACGNLRLVKQVLRVGVFVACDPDFTEHPKVANGASDLLVATFGPAGKHARAAVGAPSLPLGAPVEVDVILELYTPGEIYGVG